MSRMGRLLLNPAPSIPRAQPTSFGAAANPANFELKLEMKLEGSGANGGVQYRSFRVPPKDNPLPPDLTP